LINSSFLLKLIEWQNESSLFTVKVRGKQWYWIYRIDFKNFTKIITAPKNIGHNKWVLFTHGSTKQCDDYMSALHFRRQSNWMVKFWSEAIRDEELFNLDQPMNLALYQTIVKSLKSNAEASMPNGGDIYVNNKSSLNNLVKSNLTHGAYTTKPLNVSNFNNVVFTSLYSKESILAPKSDEIVELTDTIKGLSDSSKHWLKSNFELTQTWVKDKSVNNLIFSSNAEETVRFYRKKTGTHDPLAIRPSYISDESVSAIKEGKCGLFYAKLPTNLAETEAKPKLHENFLVRKQKRYKVRKEIAPKKITLSRSVISKINESIVANTDNVEAVMKDVGAKLLIKKNRSLDMPRDNTALARRYKVFKVNKKKNEVNNLNINRRMLRTRRTLILPAHVNITAVTNSFDVIHSWFIPGLGLKMDCIPGRATHHTFYIDNVGFYYGQCAEVCGRYHHHMPIRICALPFDHFLLW